MIQPSSSRLPLIALVGLLLLAFALRWDVHQGTYFADELIPQAVVKHMQSSGTLDTNWEHADWHGDFAGGFYKLKQYNFSSYHTSLYLFQTICSSLGAGDVPVLVIYRVFSVWCQLLALLLVFSMAKNLYGSRAAIFAAMFLAIVPQAVVDAHYARPESFVILLVALACWLALKNCTQKKSSYALLEAFVWGVAFACKFSFFPMVAVAYAGSCFTLKRWSNVLLWPAGFILGVVVSAPYIVRDMAGFMHGVGLLTHQYSALDAQGGWESFPSLWQLLAYLSVFFSVPVFLVMLASGLPPQKSGRWFFVIVFVVSIFYLLVFSAQGVFFERNFSHLLSLWAVMFGAGADALLKRMNGGWRLSTMKSLLFLCMTWLLFLSVKIDRELFIGLEDNQQKISDNEANLLKEFSAIRIVPFNVLNPDGTGQLQPSALLRVPMPKENSTGLIDKLLQENGFERVATMELPLAFLPYSQLQINQLPPAYTYYRKKQLDIEQERSGKENFP